MATKLEGKIVCPKIYLLAYVTFNNNVISRDNYVMMSKQPPSWIHHLGFQFFSKMSENRQKLLKSTEKQKIVQERPKKVKIIALKLIFINKHIQKSIKGYPLLTLYFKFGKIRLSKCHCQRVSMGLTVSRKTVKTLAVKRKNCLKKLPLAVKKLTVKNFSHESRSLKSLIRTFVSCVLRVFAAQNVL